ncbi:MAG: PspC domain-containing protein, partial [bacterium]
MEQQKTSTEPKKLYRSKVDRIIGGVCGGFAEYFNIDATIIRVLWLVILFLTGIWIGLVIYLVCLIVMKDNPEQSFADKKPQSTALYWGIALVLLGLVLISNRWDWDWFYYRPFHFPIFRPWFFGWDRFWPVLIILFGVFYLIYVLRKNKQSETSENRTEAKQLPGRLFRARDDKIIGGVCGGLAKNLNVDPVIV